MEPSEVTESLTSADQSLISSILKSEQMFVPDFLKHPKGVPVISLGLSETTTDLLDPIYKAAFHTERDNCRMCGLVSSNRKGTEWKGGPSTCMSDSTLSCTMVGGLVFGEMILTSTPSMKSLLATWTWNLWPQFFTQVSRTCRKKVKEREREREIKG